MSAQQPSGSALTREAILRALSSLSEELGKQNVTGELCLFGTVMVLAFTARLSTKDVDALFQTTPLIREIARRIGEEQHLPTDWLNDGVKGFLSARHDVTAGNLPQFPHLRLTMPVPEYLLAMKCMAARIGGTSGEASDIPDIVFLAWTSAEQRALHRPWFASPLAALRAVLLLESPPAFRARNLFVSDNALSRA